MDELLGTEEVELDATELMDAVPSPFTGLADDINCEIESLVAARDLAVTFEGGLDTQAAINKHAIELRGILFASKKNCHGLYAETLNIKATLLESIGDVQKASKKEALVAKIAKMEADLAEL